MAYHFNWTCAYQNETWYDVHGDGQNTAFRFGIRRRDGCENTIHAAMSNTPETLSAWLES